MGTHALVGGVTADGEKLGVYVHYDGMPDYMLPALRAMVERDGAAEVIDTLLAATSGGWSYLSHEYVADRDGRGFEPVDGYGVRFNDSPGRDPQPAETATGGFLSYVYFVTREGEVEWAQVTGGYPEDWSWRVEAVAR